MSDGGEDPSLYSIRCIGYENGVSETVHTCRYVLITGRVSIMILVAREIGTQLVAVHGVMTGLKVE